MRRALILTHLPFNEAGNQVLKQTLSQFTRAGWQVELITIPFTVRGKQATPPPGISIWTLRSYYLSLVNSILDSKCLYKIYATFKRVNPDPVGYGRPSLRPRRVPIWSAYNPLAMLCLPVVTWRLFMEGRRILRLRKPDLIMGYEVWSVPAACILGKLYGIPSVARYQGTIASDDLDRGGKFPFLKHYNNIIAMKCPVNLHIFGDDGTQGDEVMKRIAKRTEGVHMIRDGVDTALLEENYDRVVARKELGIPANSKVLLTLSRLANWKRIDRAIYCVSEIVNHYGRKDVYLVVVGDGPQKDFLHRLAQSLKCSENVRFAGPVPHEKVGKYLAGADLFLSLNDLTNVCNPVYEAMLFGRPILALDTGATHSLVNGSNGILVSLGDVEHLPEKVLETINDESLLEELGRNAREFACSQLRSWPERGELEMEIIEGLIDSGC